MVKLHFKVSFQPALVGCIQECKNAGGTKKKGQNSFGRMGGEPTASAFDAKTGGYRGQRKGVGANKSGEHTLHQNAIPSYCIYGAPKIYSPSQQLSHVHQIVLSHRCMRRCIFWPPISTSPRTQHFANRAKWVLHYEGAWLAICNCRATGPKGKECGWSCPRS